MLEKTLSKCFAEEGCSETATRFVRGFPLCDVHAKIAVKGWLKQCEIEGSHLWAINAGDRVCGQCGLIQLSTGEMVGFTAGCIAEEGGK